MDLKIEETLNKTEKSTTRTLYIRRELLHLAEVYAKGHKTNFNRVLSSLLAAYLDEQEGK